MSITTDFIIENTGSIILFRPMTDDARKWLDFNCVPEPWQWFGDAMACEPRCADNIIDGLRDSGFTIAAR